MPSRHIYTGPTSPSSWESNARAARHCATHSTQPQALCTIIPLPPPKKKGKLVDLPTGKLSYKLEGAKQKTRAMPDADDFLIDEIVDKRKQNGRVEYLIKVCGLLRSASCTAA